MVFFIILVLLPTITSSLKEQPVEVTSGLINALSETIRQSDETSHEAVQLLLNVFQQITKYECERNDDDCVSWRAVNLIEELELSKVNCDKNPENEICMGAKELLGGETTHDRISAGLLSVAEGVSSDDFQYLNAIRDDVIDFICHKQPSKCHYIRLN